MKLIATLIAASLFAHATLAACGFAALLVAILSMRPQGLFAKRGH